MSRPLIATREASSARARADLLADREPHSDDLYELVCQRLRATTAERLRERRAAKARKEAPVRSTMTTKRVAVAAMSRQKSDTPKKPAGCRYHSETFWKKGGDRKVCKECLAVSGLDDAPLLSHKRACSSHPWAPGRLALATALDASAAPPPTVRSLPMLGPPVLPAVLPLLRPVPRAPLPEESAVYTEAVRRDPCCNCGKPPRSTIHHEPSGAPVPRRGKGQRVRDTLGASLCWEPCHRIYTGGPGQSAGYLPDPDGPFLDGKPTLRTREKSLEILHADQEARLLRALWMLSPEWRVEVLSVAVARVPEDVLGQVLLGEPPPSAAEQALTKALDETRGNA